MDEHNNIFNPSFSNKNILLKLDSNTILRMKFNKKKKKKKIKIIVTIKLNKINKLLL